MTYSIPYYAELRVEIFTESIKPLRTIPGVGSSLARDLYLLVIQQISDLKDHSPETLFNDLWHLSGVDVDPCVLYTFRCAVYFASITNHNPKLLEW